MPETKAIAYRALWLVAGVVILVSVFLPYVYNRTLIAIMQDYLPKMFNVFYNFSEANLAITLSDIAFILILIGGVLSIVYAIATFGKKPNQERPRIARIWNTATFCLVGVVLFSCPIILYVNGVLTQVSAFIGAQYYPVFEGFDVGFYVTWVSTILAVIAVWAILRQEEPKVAEVKVTNVNVKV